MKKEETNRKEIRTHRPKINPKNIWVNLMIMTCLLTTPSTADAFVLKENEHKDNKKELSDFNHSEEEILNKDIKQLIKNESVKEKVILKIAEEQTQQLQNQIFENAFKLKSDIETANSHGRKKTFISKLFLQVSPVSLSGDNNYCVAGAMSSFYNVNDPILKPVINKMLASKELSPKDLNLFSHPNISCPAFRIYYKQALGANFIDKNTPDFKEQIQKLEKGDIIMVYSSQNTSSGLHCVTFEKYKEGSGEICVKSFNKEKDQTYKLKQICCVAKFPNQFRETLIKELSQNDKLLISLLKQSPSLFASALIQNTVSNTKPLQANKTSYHSSELSML